MRDGGGLDQGGEACEKWPDSGWVSEDCPQNGPSTFMDSKWEYSTMLNPKNASYRSFRHGTELMGKTCQYAQ